MPERDASPGATRPERASARPPSGTLALERDARPSVADGVGGGAFAWPAPLGPRSRLPSAREVDVELLDDAERDLVLQVAFARAAVASGAVPADAIVGAPGEGRIEDRLLAAGLLDPMQAMELYAEVQTAREVCFLCLHLLEAPLSPERPCSTCGGCPAEGPAPVAGGTIDGGAEEARGLQGFPGEGGRFGGYDVLARIAEGGMGVVFRARDRALNRVVALKVMRGGALASKLRRRRFLQEAEAAAGLHHPNIVPIHQIDEVNRYPFYTMDFVEGLPLDVHVRRAGAGPRVAAGLLATIAEAVQHFHQRGLIHRDLKPENILVTPEGAPKIIDFGIAKKVGDAFSGDSGSWTVEGDLLGTPHYMSPEQAAGRVQEVDTRSDVYALGTILYELLAGAPPFHGLPQARLLLAIQEDDPRSLRAQRHEVEADLEAITFKALAKEPERRYQSAIELAQDLRRYLEDRPILARPATLRYRAKKFLRRRWPAAAASAAVVATAVTALGWVALERRARRAQIDELLQQAAAAALEERPLLYERVLGVDPDNAVARARRDAARLELDTLEAARNLEDERRLAAEREKSLRAAEELERERARAAEEREQQRVRAEERARERARRRAEQLAAEARGVADPLAAVSLLGDALVVVPPDARELRLEIEGRKVEVCLELTETALASGQAGLAGFWLEQARKLEAAAARREALDQLAARIDDLASGRRLVAEAHDLLERGELLTARDLLRQAGSEVPGVRDELALVEARCRSVADRLVDEAVALLDEGRGALTLARAREARRYAPGHERAAAIGERAARHVARQASLRALRLFEQPEGTAAGLDLLAETVRTLEGTAAAARLGAELAHRRALLRAPDRDHLIYVPAVAELGVRPFLIQRREVTNQEYLAFVADGGYEAEWFSADARPHLPSFRDGTLREARHPGPRSWQGGSYGDPANAQRPVRGVSWDEAEAYARWRSARTGQRWRLPEAREWEVAAGWDPERRALRRYPWGEAFEGHPLLLEASLPALAGCTPQDRSPLGLLDVGGGVAEWVRAPEGPGLKGAHFAADATLARFLAQVRATGTPGPRPPVQLAVRVGFRLVRELDPVPR